MSRGLIPPFAAFAVGATLAFAASAVVGLDKAAFGDAEAYLAPARAIIERRPYPRLSPVGEYMFRGPGYPFVIAAVWRLAPYSIAAVKVANALAFGLLCAVVSVIALRASGGSRRGATLAGLLLAANPLFLMMATDVQTGIWHAALVAAAVQCVLESARRGGFRWTALAGL